MSKHVGYLHNLQSEIHVKQWARPYILMHYYFFSSVCVKHFSNFPCVGWKCVCRLWRAGVGWVDLGLGEDFLRREAQFKQIKIN